MPQSPPRLSESISPCSYARSTDFARATLLLAVDPRICRAVGTNSGRPRDTSRTGGAQSLDDARAARLRVDRRTRSHRESRGDQGEAIEPQVLNLLPKRPVEPCRALERCNLILELLAAWTERCKATRRLDETYVPGDVARRSIWISSMLRRLARPGVRADAGAARYSLAFRSALAIRAQA
jgi:hypothetical protein